jgi:hypothetical protein
MFLSVLWLKTDGLHGNYVVVEYEGIARRLACNMCGKQKIIFFPKAVKKDSTSENYV